MTEKSKARPTPHLQIGQPFNPFGLFNGIFIPEALVKFEGISPGAKLAFGRLARYAGQDGRCYPAMATLASEIGVGLRQAQKYLAELERSKLIRRVSRFSGRGQTSNAFEFLWHPLFEEGVNDNSPPGVNDRSLKESHSEETKTDLDYPPTNRKNCDSRLDGDFTNNGLRPYPELREALADYMMLPGDDERVYPSDRQVVDVMDAAGGASEEDVVQCLQYLYYERGLRPGTKYGPRHFSWFKTTVADYFAQKRDRALVINAIAPTGGGPGLSKAEFELMTEPLEIDDV